LLKSWERQQGSLQGSDGCIGKGNTNDYDDKHGHDQDDEQAL
jgi:hypothetical protein